MVKYKILVVALVAFLAGASTCFADSVALTPSSSFLTSYDSADSFTIGWQFTVNSPVTVTGLGYYGGGLSDILATSHDVGIFDSNGNLLVSATIPAGGGTLDDGFLFVSGFPKPTLTSGTYVIGAESMKSADSVVVEAAGLSTISQITVNNPALISLGSTALTLPTQDNSGTDPFTGMEFTYFGPNFEVTPVPEPSTWLLFGTGLLALAFFGRRLLSTGKEQQKIA